MALVNARLGLRIQAHQRQPFAQRIEQLQSRFAIWGQHELEQLIQGGRVDDPAFEFLVAGITVGESYFFRDRNQLDFLQQRFLPQLIARLRRSGRNDPRIWSAGCSDGQELYSILLMLQQLLPENEHWRPFLLGTDINADALKRARSAEYSEWSLRQVDAPTRNKLFERQENLWRLRLERFAGSVRFDYLNLVESSYPSMLQGVHSLDLILCRNVFIYFDRPTIESILARFAKCLNPGGMAMIGACDYAPEHVAGLTLHAIGDVFYYLREEFAAPAAEPPPPPSVASGSWTATIATAAQFAQAIEPVAATQPVIPTQPVAPKAPAASPDVAAPSRAQIDEMIAHGRAAQALELVQSAQRAVYHPPPEMDLLHGHCLASLGRMDEARSALERFTRNNELEPQAYFLLALVAMEQARLRDAEALLRRTLLLDPALIMAHYHMGVLKLRQGRADAGRKALRRALSLLEAATPDAPIALGDGMTHAQLADALNQELEAAP
ncbi:putative chemotaxis protein CheR [Magnetofaba australis IT-1]|uniref:Putative chemotaxis protein CheR n=2 Tax=Magnetofaba TaxID=1472292 RepID=A0A1Y2K0E6_9PROT|nr:putative chemotaxis protein CheR [Magnetofaba australis IT-1]